MYGKGVPDRDRSLQKSRTRGGGKGGRSSRRRPVDYRSESFAFTPVSSHVLAYLMKT
jgi:hypothetical protein